MEEKKNELRDCPFCGGNAAVVWDWHGTRVSVYCHDCGAKSATCVYGRGKLPVGGKRMKTSEEARAEVVRLWNMRI